MSSIDLSKRSVSEPVRLSKGDVSQVSLAKGGTPFRVNLNWSANSSAKKGLFAKLAGNTAVDLDLGALYELTDGSKGVVQALGNAFGSLARAPFIELDGDDRSGSAVGGENLRISAEHQGQIKRVLLFTYIYEGVPRWEDTDGVITISQDGVADVIIPIDAADGKKMVALALIENRGGALTLTREVKFVAGHKQLDEAYNWGLNWTPGAK